jgi:hypothetical protein
MQVFRGVGSKADRAVRRKPSREVGSQAGRHADRGRLQACRKIDR